MGGRRGVRDGRRGLGGPWSAADPRPNERGGLGLFRGRGRAGPHVQIQPQGRPGEGPTLHARRCVGTSHPGRTSRPSRRASNVAPCLAGHAYAHEAQ